MFRQDRSIERPHMYGVDVLRGVAISSVVAYHSWGLRHPWSLPWDGWTRDFSGTSRSTSLLTHLMGCGWAGVALFFVLSGFCIHLAFLRRGDFHATGFFWRRFWRIYPAYLVALVVFATWNGASRWQLATHALFLHNLTDRTLFGINASFWSIATEVQLYLLYPVMLWLRARFGMRKGLAITLAVGCIWRVATQSIRLLPDHLAGAAWASPLMTWFDWTLGAFVAERFATGERAFRRPNLALGCSAALFIASTLFKPLAAFSFTAAALCSATILDRAIRLRWRGWPLADALAATGLVSYSIYLWHQPLLVPISGFLSRYVHRITNVGVWAGYGGAVCVITIASYWLLERPGIRLGNSIWSAARSLKRWRQYANQSSGAELPQSG